MSLKDIVPMVQHSHGSAEYLLFTTFILHAGGTGMLRAPFLLVCSSWRCINTIAWLFDQVSVSFLCPWKYQYENCHFSCILGSCKHHNYRKEVNPLRIQENSCFYTTAGETEDRTICRLNTARTLMAIAVEFPFISGNLQEDETWIWSLNSQKYS